MQRGIFFEKVNGYYEESNEERKIIDVMGTFRKHGMFFSLIYRSI